MSDPTPPELPISVRRQMLEREEYVAVYGENPPALVGGPFFSGFLATRMAQARVTGTPWEQDYYLGDPVHLLAEMRRKLPAAFVERQIARAQFKLEYLLKKGLLASSIAQGDVEGMLAAGGDRVRRQRERGILMLRVAIYACCLSLLLLMAVWSTPAAGQGADSVRLHAAVDTLRREGCRGGTITASGACTGRLYAARSATVFRLALRLDSLTRSASVPPVTPAPVASVTVGFGTTWRARYNAEWPGNVATPGVDTVTVCAVVYPTLGDTVRANARVGWPVLRLTLTGDTALVGVRGGNALSAMCDPAVRRWGERVTTDSVTAPRVAWSMERVQVRDPDGVLRFRWRPVPGPP